MDLMRNRLSGLPAILSEMMRRPDQRASNAAVLLGLLYVLLAGPYVGMLPSLPFLTLFSCLLGIGIIARAVDKIGTLENEWGIRDTLNIGVLLSLPTLYWRYSHKFLGMSSDYLSKMATDIPCKTGIGCVLDAQQNLAFYPMDKMVLFFGGLTLLLFMLVQNEFSSISNLTGKAYRTLRRFARDPRKGYEDLIAGFRHKIAVIRTSPETAIKDRIDPVTGVKVGEIEVELEKPGDSHAHLAEASLGSAFYDVSTSLFAITVFFACY